MTRRLAAALVAAALGVGIAVVVFGERGEPAATNQAHRHGHASSSAMPDPAPIRLGPQGRHPQFVVECTPGHTAPDDPIVFPGLPGASHLHQFFGSLAADARSTGESLQNTRTTCQDTADTAAYWVPVLHDGTTEIEPELLVAYYRTGVDVEPEDVRSWPLGLAMIAGDPGADTEQSLGVVAWSCGASDHLTVRPRRCSPRAPLTLRLVFPDCWDGRNTDSSDHRSHLAYSNAGRCPGAHPVPIVQLILAVHYRFHGEPGGLRLASGSILTGHGDVLNGWSDDELARLTDVCLRRGQVCGVASNRTDL